MLTVEFWLAAVAGTGTLLTFGDQLFGWWERIYS
jgi:hypothetical protein